jgi:nitroreductase
LKRAKLRLQFTGWLQYLPTAVVGVCLLIVSAAGALIGTWQIVLFRVPFCIGALLVAAAAFDVLTVKLGLRPREPLPRRRDDLHIFDLMRARRSCRSFQSRDLTSADRAELKEAVHEYTHPDQLIGTSPIRLEYIAAPLTVWPTVGGHEFIVAIAPHAYDRLSIIDIGRSLQKVVLRATRMGVATCWIGQGADQSSIVQHLGDRFDPERDHVVCVCAVGYRSRFKPLAVRVIERVQRRRLPLTSLFFTDARLRRPLAPEAAPFAPFRRCFEACQWAPSSLNSQTTRCVTVTDGTGRAVRRLDFCATTASRYYAPVALGIWCANWEVGSGALGITGRFQVLSPGERGLDEATELPRYDVSWIPDSSVSAHVMAD